jgi:hypothetical protein
MSQLLASVLAVVEREAARSTQVNRHTSRHVRIGFAFC